MRFVLMFVLALVALWILAPEGRSAHGCVRCAQGFCRAHGSAK